MMPTNDSNEEENNITLRCIDKMYRRKNQILIATLLILTGVTITILVVVVSDSHEQGKFQR